jgi:diaminopimelate epimerase
VSSKEIRYVSASGCGNVFLLVDAAMAPVEARAEITRKMCAQLSADGVEWTAASISSGADVDAGLINADGSEAEISGNGTRCVAAWWVSGHGGELVRVRTGAGIKECRLIRREANEFEFEMNLGEPLLQGELELALPSDKRIGTRLSMGNPQFVVFVDGFDFDWQKVGAEIQAQAVFTEGTNVDFVRVVGTAEIEARFFERGVGETQSSGTGSCASAVATIAAGKAKSPVRVNAVGGSQTVVWEKGVLLRGPARVEEEGTFRL